MPRSGGVVHDMSLHITFLLVASFLLAPGRAFLAVGVQKMLQVTPRTTLSFLSRRGPLRTLKEKRIHGCYTGVVRMSTEVEQRSPLANGNSPQSTTETEDVKKPPVKKRVVSGVQPTGNLHLGNYLGAVKQWADGQVSSTAGGPRSRRAHAAVEAISRAMVILTIMKVTQPNAESKDDRENYFFVVDLHAITVPQDPKKLEAAVTSAAATFLAAGVDPKKSKVFIQSHISAHAELMWLLSCVTPLNWLERMVQYKEKKVKQGDNVGSGLLTYPVLMASDILLYQPDLVPVGEDQRQHLELTRDIARRFNDQFCKRKRKTFKDPQALIVKEGARIMSLTDGTSKMSKSDPADGSRINLTDPPDVITKKIKKCKTDLFQGLEWDNPERPECTNLLTIYQAVTGKSREEITLEVQDMSWGAFKPLLADATVAHLEPFQARYKELLDDRAYLNQVLRDGADAANELASQTLEWARDAMGIPSLKKFQ